MAIIESWYLDDKKLFSLPIMHRLTISRGRNRLGEKEKLLVRDEDTVILRRYHQTRPTYTIDPPSFVTDVDELLRLRQLPSYIQETTIPKRKPSEQELYQDAMNIHGGISARRLGRLHSKVTWQTSLHDEPVRVADRFISRYQPAVNAWTAKARTIFQI